MSICYDSFNNSAKNMPIIIQSQFHSLTSNRIWFRLHIDRIKEGENLNHQLALSLIFGFIQAILKGSYPGLSIAGKFFKTSF